MQPNLIILETLANGTRRSHALSQLPAISAQDNARYAVVDTNTGKVPAGLTLQREGNTLKVLVNAETVVQITDFYNADVLAQFSTEGTVSANDDVLISAASDETASLSGAASGDEFAGLTVAQAIYSLGAFIVVVGAAAVKHSNNNDDDDNSVIPTLSGPIPGLASDSGSSDSDLITNDGTINVSNIKEGATWEFSTDGGVTWFNGIGNSFELSSNTTYAAEDIQLRQTSSAGNLSRTVSNSAPVIIDSLAPTIAFTHATYDDIHNLILLTGTNVNSLLDSDETSSTNIAGKMDWSKLEWDINDDNTGNITFAEGDIDNMVALNDTTVIIELTSSKATAIESDPDYGPTVPDVLHIEAGFSRDTAGNASTTDGFNSEPFTSTVIFDLVNGQSSSHSNRTFDADTTYTIYIMVSSEIAVLNPAPQWIENGALGADDTIILAGTGSPIIGALFRQPIFNSGISSSNTYNDFRAEWQSAFFVATGWGDKIPIAQDAIEFKLHQGSISRVGLFSTLRILLWTGSNSHASSPQIGYMTHLPAGAFTSQGLV